jgi:hypothetical protein
MMHPIRTMLRTLGVGRALLRVREAKQLLSDPGYRRRRREEIGEYFEWLRRHGSTLRPALYPAGARQRVLIVSKGTLNGAQIEMALIKGLELGGFVPVVLTDRVELEKHYRIAGVESFVRWELVNEPEPLAEAQAIVDRATAIEDLLPVEHLGARVGKFALSTTFRALRLGRLDLTQPVIREKLAKHLASGMARASIAQRIVSEVQPDLALFMGNRYTGQGELMDVCLERGVDVLTWFDAHRSSSLMLKRYRLDNRDLHHGSISDESWELLQDMPWTAALRDELNREFRDNYAAGDWYSRGATTRNKTILPGATLRTRLNLDPAKKTAVIFPHVVWDATLFWGTDLFANYEDWLVETVRAATLNDRVNWIVKIHPVHEQKKALKGYHEQPAELTAIANRVGPLPDHVKVIPADTDINTYSLFAIMDYCLTVRGTIGIEAASLGQRVLTAGTGRYDHRGFTTDSATREEYLHRVATIEALPPLTPAERELAERFAYGAFLLRPLPLTTLSIEFAHAAAAFSQITVHAKSSADLRAAPDLNAFGAWAADGRQEDFLWRIPEAAALGRSA